MSSRRAPSRSFRRVVARVQLLIEPSVHSDYIENQRLDRYDVGDINDDDDFSDDPDARRAAEARMKVRDRRAARGAPAAEGRRKARMPAFLASDDEDSEDEGRLLGARRVRRNYDEQPDDDGEPDVSISYRVYPERELTRIGIQEMPLEQLSDIRADSVAQWIEDPRARRTIMREFKGFLMTYTDIAGISIYGQRIRALGEGQSRLPVALDHP